MHDTPEICTALKSWGIVDNMKGAVRTSMSFKDKVLSLHTDYLGMQEQKDSKVYSSLLKQVKSARCMDMAMPQNTFGQYWNLASRTGPVWDCITKLLTGEVHVMQGKPKVKPLRSAAPLLYMGGIDESILAQMLGDVVSGEITLKQFTLDCKKVKARMRVQTDILRFEEIGLLDWNQAEEKFPTACSAIFVERWAQVVVSKQILLKDSLPSTFFSDLSARIAVDHNLQETEKSKAEVRI